jgi:cobalamin biosynthesis protein CobT
VTANSKAKKPADEVIEALRSNSAIASIAKHTRFPIEKVVALVQESVNYTELTNAVDREDHEEVWPPKGNALFDTPDRSEQFRVELNAARQLLGREPYVWTDE